MRYLGQSAQAVRQRLSLTQEAMAFELDISVVHLSNIENDKAMPSPKLLNRYQELSGVDLYVLDWCADPQISELPQPVQSAAARLRELWLEHFD